MGLAGEGGVSVGGRGEGASGVSVGASVTVGEGWGVRVLVGGGGRVSVAGDKTVAGTAVSAVGELSTWNEQPASATAKTEQHMAKIIFRDISTLRPGMLSRRADLSLVVSSVFLAAE